MKNKTLKILIASQIIENKDLSKESKKQYLNFILKEANEIQLKSLFLDQKVYTNLDEQSKDIIEGRWNNFINHPATGYILPTIISFEILFVIATSIYKKYFTAIARECSKYSADSKQQYICMRKARIQALQKKLTFLKSNINKCSKSKDPEKCKNRITNEIKDTERRIEVNKDWIEKKTNKIFK